MRKICLAVVLFFVFAVESKTLTKGLSASNSTEAMGGCPSYNSECSAYVNYRMGLMSRSGEGCSAVVCAYAEHETWPPGEDKKEKCYCVPLYCSFAFGNITYSYAECEGGRTACSGQRWENDGGNSCYWGYNSSNCGMVHFSYSVSGSVILTCEEDIFIDCDLEQIATNDSAFSTGNLGRYTLWQLSEGEKTVIPLSSLPNSSVPSPADFDQMNVAVSLDEDGNFLGYGWSGNATQAIWVDPENIEGCEADENGYFVFNSSVEGSGGGYVYEGNCINGDCGGGGGGGTGGGGGGGREPPDKIDTVIYYPPNTPGEKPNSSPDYTPWFEKIYDKIPSLSDLKDGILDPVLEKLDSLPQKIGSVIPNPLPILQNIYNFLTGTETPDFVIAFPELEDPNVGDLDSLIIDTIPPDTNFVFDDEEFKRNLDSILPDTLPFKKELDSLFPKEVDTVALTEKVKDALKEDIAKIKEKTEDMLEPLKNLFTGGSSGGDACECLTSGLRLGLGNGYSSFEATAYGWVMGFVCDKFILIRTIVLLMASVISLGMVLKVLRS